MPSRCAYSWSSCLCAGIENPCSCSLDETRTYMTAVRPGEGFAAGCWRARLFMAVRISERCQCRRKGVPRTILAGSRGIGQLAQGTFAQLRQPFLQLRSRRTPVACWPLPSSGAPREREVWRFVACSSRCKESGAATMAAPGVVSPTTLLPSAPARTPRMPRARALARVPARQLQRRDAAVRNCGDRH